MWKPILGFVAFAALALFVNMKGGDRLDMGGEKHEAGVGHEVAPTASALSAASK